MKNRRENGGVTLVERIAYPLGLAGKNMVYNFMSMYILFFFTDLLGIPAAIATGIIVAASAWDVINDPLMGLITDRTRTRLGKLRPYLIFGPVVLAIMFALCFCDFGLAQVAAIGVAALFYVLWGMSYTVCDIPIWAISSAGPKARARAGQASTHTGARPLARRSAQPSHLVEWPSSSLTLGAP